MKLAKVKNEFKPIELQLTIESKRELEFLISFFGATAAAQARETANNGRFVKDGIIKPFEQCEGLYLDFFEELVKHHPECNEAWENLQ